MSIIGKNGEESISMPGFWETMMKLAVLLAVPVFTLGCSWAVWVTNRSFSQERDIAVMQESLGEIKSRVHGVASQVGKIPSKVAAAVQPPNDD